MNVTEYLLKHLERQEQISQYREQWSSYLSDLDEYYGHKYQDVNFSVQPGPAIRFNASS
jgi:hypothetical protein